jgi:hypothetical protein
MVAKPPAHPQELVHLSVLSLSEALPSGRKLYPQPHYVPTALYSSLAVEA